jgi:tRNA nucleotidyltransferase (CCA-adding enzyme)
MPDITDEIEKEMLKKVTPTPMERERVESIVESLIDKVCRSAEEYEERIETLLVGSVARDTWLPPNPDIDVFMMFPLETPIERMEEVGLEIGKKIIGGETRYAEHPYAHGIIDGFEVDLVPCYRIDNPEQRMTAVDRTPLHQRYVIERLKEEQKKEVRLLKRFLKGIGVYGAEAKIQGFSGYLTELLVLKFGTFRRTVESASTWKKRFEIEFVPPSKRFEEPLVVVDPIDASRNVASALSVGNYSRFAFACKSYLESASEKFFFPNDLPALPGEKISEMMGERGTHFLALVFEAPGLVDDVLYPQLIKCLRTLVDHCSQHGFGVHGSSYEVIGPEAVMLLELEISRLSSMVKHAGPPVWVKDSERFLEKWNSSENAISKPYIEDDHWVVDIRRPYTDVRTSIVENLDRLSLGKNVSESLKKGCTILENGELVKEGYLEFLTRYLDKRMPWQH